MTPTDPLLFVYLAVGMLLVIAAAGVLEWLFPDTN